MTHSITRLARRLSYRWDGHRLTIETPGGTCRLTGEEARALHDALAYVADPAMMADVVHQHERDIEMSNYTEKLKLDAGGDVLEVRYDGTMYVAPSCGAQHATRHDAMQVELYHYLSACGEDVEIDDVDPDEYGDWIDDEEE